MLIRLLKIAEKLNVRLTDNSVFTFVCMNENQVAPLGRIKHHDRRRSFRRMDVCPTYNSSKRCHFRVVEDDNGWTADLD
jgi:hypothetical protein